MSDVFTTDELSEEEKQDILADIKPKIEACGLETEARTCDTCNNTIRLSDRNARGVIVLGTFTGWKGSPSSEIDGFYCPEHTPKLLDLIQSNGKMPTFRNQAVAVTVTEQNGAINIKKIKHESTNRL